VVRRIQLELFDATPGGLPGNDDGGTTSAWYVLSALGIYPAVPGTSGVSIGSPLFEDAIVHLMNGRDVHIIGRGASVGAPYVRDLSLDGVPYNDVWIDWNRLSSGATLEFSLGAAATRWPSH
jgi:putative alpha-1,2-mannosidase